jgi:hypothetical protein
VSDVTPHDEVGEPPADREDTAEVPQPVAHDLPGEDQVSWHTTEIPSAAAMLPAGIWLAFVFVAALGLLIGIAAAALTRPGQPGAVVATATIGPDGGEVRFDSRGVVRVPDQAVDRAVKIEVRRTRIRRRLRVATPQGPAYAFEPDRLAAYTFAPASVTFARPVTIVLPLSSTGRNGAAFFTANGRVVFLPGSVDAKAGVVSFTVTDFRFESGLAGGS